MHVGLCFTFTHLISASSLYILTEHDFFQSSVLAGPQKALKANSNHRLRWKTDLTPAGNSSGIDFDWISQYLLPASESEPYQVSKGLCDQIKQLGFRDCAPLRGIHHTINQLILASVKPLIHNKGVMECGKYTNSHLFFSGKCSTPLPLPPPAL